MSCVHDRVNGRYWIQFPDSSLTTPELSTLLSALLVTSGFAAFNQRNIQAAIKLWGNDRKDQELQDLCVHQARGVCI